MGDETSDSTRSRIGSEGGPLGDVVQTTRRWPGLEEQADDGGTVLLNPVVQDFMARVAGKAYRDRPITARGAFVAMTAAPGQLGLDDEIRSIFIENDSATGISVYLGTDASNGGTPFAVVAAGKARVYPVPDGAARAVTFVPKVDDPGFYRVWLSNSAWSPNGWTL